jgi:CRP/FNR family cyclic AMP-dependent transcriptional regulator
MIRGTALGRWITVRPMSQSSYLEHLGRIPLFRSCNKKELSIIAKSVDELTVAAGRVLTSEGAAAREAFVIVDGEASVTIDGSEIAKLGPGDHFGELALLDGGPRTATVTAITDLTVVVVDQRSFFALLDEVPGLSRKILATLAAIIRDLNVQVSAK